MILNLFGGGDVSIDPEDIISACGPIEYGHGGYDRHYTEIKLRNGDRIPVTESVETIDKLRFNHG